MDCKEFGARIGEFDDPGGESGPFAEHAAGCPECARRLARARALRRAIRDLPRVPAPREIVDRIRSRAFAVRASPLRTLVRVAAVLLALAAGTLAILNSLGPTYDPLELTFVDDDVDGSHEEDLALEHIFGPPSSLVADGSPSRR